MLRSLRRALHPARLRLPARRFTADIAALPPTAREAFGTSVSAEEAIVYNRSRVATATAVALYRSGYRLPTPDDHLHDAVHALDPALGAQRGDPRSHPRRSRRPGRRLHDHRDPLTHPAPPVGRRPPRRPTGKGGPVYLVTPDPAHGLVVAPRSSDDLTPATEQALTAQDFTWNTEIEAYTRPTDHAPEDVERTADALRALGHYVIS
ncbi:hypothetical protein [Streptomyces sp. NPDC004976]